MLTVGHIEVNIVFQNTAPDINNNNNSGYLYNAQVHLSVLMALKENYM